MTMRPGPRTLAGALLAFALAVPVLEDAVLPSAPVVTIEPALPPGAGVRARADVAAATADRPPLAFERLDGDGGQARYRAYGSGYALDVLPGEVRIATARPDQAAKGDGLRAGVAARAGRTPRFDLSRMVIAGARPVPLRGVGALPSVSNSFVGTDPARWRTGVPHSGRVVAEGVYQGVDLVYYGRDGRLQYDFLVAPGADPSVITLAFPEAASLHVDRQGRLHVGREDAEPLVTSAPVLYQDIGGERRPVDGRFAVDAAAREARFEVGPYDTAHTLVIDPVLEYGTYFGAVSPTSGGLTQPAALGVDRYGAMYIAGWTTGALPLPTPPGGNTGVPVGSDAFIAKFNAAGQLVYTTRYGGSGDDQARDIAVSLAGDVAIVGLTGSAGLPGTTAPGVYDPTFDGPTDGFVARFSLAGAPVWASYVGGKAPAESVFESLERIVLEPTGQLLVAGSVLDVGTLNGVDPTFNSNPLHDPFQPTDGFIGRFSAAGALLNATYLGTKEYDDIRALGRSSSGAVLVAGSTASTFRADYGITSAAAQPTCGVVMGEDGGCPFVARLANDLRSIPAATFLGSQFDVTLSDLAADPDSSVVLVGQVSSSALLPATPGAFDDKLEGFSDAFVARLPAALEKVEALTYLGGAGDDFGQSVALDAGGQIHVSGVTSSADFPVQAGALKTSSDGSPDAFLVKFQPTLAAASYLSRVGGVDDESGARILVGPAGRLYLLGASGPLVGAGETTPRATIPVTSDAFRSTRAPGATEAFLYRLGPGFDSEYPTVVRAAPASIPDAATVPGTLNSTFTVTNAVGVLDRVEVSFYVTHSVRRQLRATLIGPTVGGVTPSVVLFQPNTVATGTAFGSSCSARTVLADSATTLITAGAAPNAGTFRPANSLSAVFSGLPANRVNGTWNLRLEDTVFGPAGVTNFLQCATVTFYYRSPDITGVSPSGTGVPAAGSAVTILGSGFDTSATVRIGGLPATVTSPTATAIGVLVPAGLGANPDVAVTNPDGRSAFAVDPFNRVSFTRSRLGDQRIGQLGFSTGNVVQASLSRDGRWLAFQTGTNVMVPGDTNGVSDIFVRDRGFTGAPPRIVRVSVGSDGRQANGASTRARISANGRYVAFVSAATNLVPDDTNGVADVFVHDRDADADGVFDETTPGARATFRVSVASSGAQANGASGQPDLSPDGYWVAFASAASNLVPSDSNAVDDIFLHHWPSGLTARVSVATGGAQANGASRAPGVSAGGRRVVFASDATNLVANDTNNARDIFLFDREDRTTTRVSTADGSTADANGASDNPSIDDRGGTIVFQTRATNLMAALGGQAVPHWQVVVMRLPVLTPFAALRGVGGMTRVGEPVVNIADALRGLLSGNSQGQPGTGDSTDAAVNGDGTAATFESGDEGLVLGDSNGQQDVFVASTSGGEAEIVSVGEDGSQGDAASQSPAVSDDGSTVAFDSTAQLTTDTNNGLSNVFVRGNSMLITTIAPQSGPLGGTSVTITGTSFSGVSVRFGGVSASVVSQTDTVLTVTAPARLQAGAVNVSVINADGQTQTAINGFTYLASGADSDLDGLPDEWETQYGLDPNSAAGHDGAGGDADGDGLTNAVEYERTTHPKGAFQRFLAEGASTDFFTTRLSLANPSEAQTATALLRFQRSDGTEVPTLVSLPPLQSKKVVVNQVPGMADAEFATLVESDALVVVDRQMWWNSSEAYGTHAEGAVKSPSLVWYLAEGATHSGFDLFYLLQNPSTTSATVKVRYLLPEGAPIEKTYTVAPNSRANIWVDNEQFPNGSGNFALANTDVSAVIEVQNNVPIIVERAMYLTRGSELFSAGHESAGVTAPALTWFLAEGATGPFFDLFVLLANPNATDAAAKVTYLLEDGRTFTQTLTVKANSRQNIWVDYATPDGTTGFPLDAQAISTKVEITNGVPIIVERAMWWPGAFTAWYEAHNSPGSTVTGTQWGLADGVVTGPPGNTATYVLIANTEASATATVQVTLLFDGLPTVSRSFAVPPSSRKTIDVGLEFPEAVGREFGALVESLPDGSTAAAQIVVERALYNDARGLFWGGGNNQLATRLR